ncbi:MAG: molybdopterin-dependent oxidoreductase, partial [Ectothiorhodospiraceae bacterium]
LGYGRGVSRFSERKRAVEDEDLGPLIATEMTRCIHCTRCVRFLDEVAGTRELAALNRGEHTEIGTYVGAGVHSEMSGNVIDLCPVGALTAKPYRYSARAWEMLSHPAVSAHDCVGSNLQLHHVRGAIKRVVPRDNESINECWIPDRDRFAYEGVYSSERLEVPMVRDDTGTWQEVDWETALEIAAESLKDVADQDGPEALGTLVAPTATLEEMYLAGRLTRALGSANIDARLREADFSDQDRVGAFPGMESTLPEVEALEAALLVGSEPRWDQPMVNHRLRKAVLRGGAVMAMNYRSYDSNYALAAERVTTPSALVGELAAVAQALVDAAGATAPTGLDALLPQDGVTDDHRAMATRLRDAARSALFLGQGVQAHPQGATLRMLAGVIAEHSASKVNLLTDGPNQAGAWLAGAVPHRQAGGASTPVAGLDARAMTATPRQGYLVLGAEVEHDCWDSAAARAALHQARNVVCLASYVTPAMREYARVLLPVGTFGETAGTYVNAEGQWQSFPGVAEPVGEARPAWKVLRVLGNVLELDGFTYDAPDAITDEVAERAGDAAPSARVAWSNPAAAPAAGELERVGLVPIYGGDALVRRATALQRTSHATGQDAARLNPATAERLGLADATTVRVQADGGDASLPLTIDDALADGAVWLPAGVAGSAGLGPMLGPVTVSRG